MTKNAKTILIMFLIYFTAILCILLTTLIKLNYDENKYGGEMADTILFVFLFGAIFYFLLFSIWTLVLYKATDRARTAFYEIGVICALGIFLPLAILLHYF